MPIECPKCGHSLAGDSRVCPRCAHDLLDSTHEGETPVTSTLWLILRSIGLLGAALVGVPVAGRVSPE